MKLRVNTSSNRDIVSPLWNENSNSNIKWKPINLIIATFLRYTFELSTNSHFVNKVCHRQWKKSIDGIYWSHPRIWFEPPREQETVTTRCKKWTSRGTWANNGEYKKRCRRSFSYSVIVTGNDSDNGKTRREIVLSLKRVRRRKDEGEDAIGASEEEKERGRKKTTRLPPEMTSPRDLGTETDLDRVNPHQAGLTRPGCSPLPSISPPHGSQSRVVLRECDVARC